MPSPVTVAHFTGGREFGGAEQVLLMTIAGLDAERWKSIVLYHPDPGMAPLADAARKMSVTIRAVPRLEAASPISRVRALTRALKSENVDLLHVHLCLPQYSKAAIVAASLARVRATVVTEHLFQPPQSGWRVHLQNLLYGRVDRFIAVSDHLAAELKDCFNGCAERVVTIRNGIAADDFDVARDAALRCQLTRGTDMPVVLTAARLHSQKGIAYLMDAARRVPQAVFVIAGDGPKRASLEAQAREAGLSNRVFFIGHSREMPRLLAACDVFVLPSLFEGLPLSVLEAMAAGKPVVASAVGGTPEAVIDGVTGLLVPPGDPVVLAEAIRALICDPDLAARMGVAGRARVQAEFTARRMVDGIARVYTEVLQ